MVDFSIVRMQARGNWHSILNWFGMPEHFLRRRHGPCPMCGGKDRWRFDDKDGAGTWFCNNCGAGDGFALVKLWTGREWKDVFNMVSAVLTGTRFDFANSDRRTRVNGAELIKKIWESSLPVQARDPVHSYITSFRRLTVKVWPDTVRTVARLRYSEKEKAARYFNGMVAQVTRLDGTVAALHRTYLKDGGLGKADVGSPKKLTPPIYDGATNGAAIRLAEPKDVLGVTEGIETGFAVMWQTDIAVWACVSSGGLSRVEIPERVRRVVIFGDNDDAGVHAATILAERLVKSGRLVNVMMPPVRGEDWCDTVVRNAGG